MVAKALMAIALCGSMAAEACGYWPTLPSRWHYRGLYRNWQGWKYAHDWKACTETGEEYGPLETWCTDDPQEHRRIKKYKKLGPPSVWIYYFGV